MAPAQANQGPPDEEANPPAEQAVEAPVFDINDQSNFYQRILFLNFTVF